MFARSLTLSERAARTQSVKAQTAIRAVRSQLDEVKDLVRARVVRLRPDLERAARAVGADSTRPFFTDDLRKLKRQQARFDALTRLLDTSEL